MKTTSWIVCMLMVTGTLASVAYASVPSGAGYVAVQEAPQARMTTADAGATDALETLLSEDEAAKFCLGCQAAFTIACGGRGSYSCTQTGDCTYTCQSNTLEL